MAFPLASRRYYAGFARILLMRPMRSTFARSRRDRTNDRAARHARTGIAVWLCRVIVGPGMHDDGSAVAVEDRLFAVTERKRVDDHRGVQRSVRAGKLIWQIARPRAAFDKIAVQLGRLEREIRSCRGEELFCMHDAVVWIMIACAPGSSPCTAMSINTPCAVCWNVAWPTDFPSSPINLATACALAAACADAASPIAKRKTTNARTPIVMVSPRSVRHGQPNDVLGPGVVAEAIIHKFVMALHTYRACEIMLTRRQWEGNILQYLSNSTLREFEIRQI